MSVDKKMTERMIITSAPDGGWTIDLTVGNATATVTTTTTTAGAIRAITELLGVIGPKEPKPVPVYHSGECDHCERPSDTLEEAYGMTSTCDKCSDVIECTVCDEELNEAGKPCCNEEHVITKKLIGDGLVQVS
jgi:hypothetical protein